MKTRECLDINGDVRGLVLILQKLGRERVLVVNGNQNYRGVYTGLDLQNGIVYVGAESVPWRDVHYLIYSKKF